MLETSINHCGTEFVPYLVADDSLHELGRLCDRVSYAATSQEKYMARSAIISLVAAVMAEHEFTGLDIDTWCQLDWEEDRDGEFGFPYSFARGRPQLHNNLPMQLDLRNWASYRREC